MTKKKSKISQEDADLFRQMVKGTVPLEQDKVEPVPTTNKTKPTHHTQYSTNSNNNFVDSDYCPEVGANEELFYCPAGLQEKQQRKLRRGQFKIEARLDLHGKTVAQASAIVFNFLKNNRSDRSRCVLIIHGRGQRSADNKPILKSMVNSWLQNNEAVVAFCSATLADGGRGAVYVLLRKN